MLAASVYATYYWFFKSKRMEQNEFFSANPDLDLAREIWNMLESTYVKKLLAKTLPNIAINKKVYIPMTDTILTLDNIDHLPMHNYYHDIDYTPPSTRRHSLEERKSLAEKIKEKTLKPFSSLRRKHYLQEESENQHKTDHLI